MMNPEMRQYVAMIAVFVVLLGAAASTRPEGEATAAAASNQELQRTVAASEF